MQATSAHMLLYTLLLYAISRFVVEFYRGDDRGFVLGWSTSQIVSIVVVPIALLMLLRLRRSRLPQPA